MKTVIVAKLRREEKFTLSFTKDKKGGGRSTIWLHPAIELAFDFDEVTRPSLNRAWIDELMRSANSNDGMTVIDEPVVPAR
ncbi:hypothetical protein ACFQD4_15260 [Subtercola frigoramans]|uniref:DUF7882 domain-containing protein n=1 Tax=Subtercola frigoramans TaxID=120298 RepID=A0ABS2L7C8_9MICO|nr:hypothetical protein [Subtercola frigoramans]MBM7473010.1 hypothetical protein [Subtercola frigoramans]